MNEHFCDERTRLIARSDILEHDETSFEDGLTSSQIVTSHDTTLSHSELYAHSCNTRKECAVGSSVKLGFRLTGNVAPPPSLWEKSCPLSWEYCLPPSCGFPPKSFPLKREPTISGETFGTRARGHPRTAPPRRRHVMPLAMRPLREESGALLAHFTSALGTHTVAAALKRASPCERLVSGSTSN